MGLLVVMVWYIIGVLSVGAGIRIFEGKVSSKDRPFIFLLGLLGPVMLVLLLFGLVGKWVNH